MFLCHFFELAHNPVYVLRILSHKGAEWVKSWSRWGHASDLSLTHFALKIYFLSKQTLNESFKGSAVMIPVKTDVLPQEFAANNPVTNRFPLHQTHTAPLAQSSTPLNPWRVYFCSDTRPRRFHLQLHLKTITEPKNRPIPLKTQLRDTERKEGVH